MKRAQAMLMLSVCVPVMASLLYWGINNAIDMARWAL